MPFQSKTGTGTSPSVDATLLARQILNKAGRNVDAAFRSLTLDSLLVRGNSTLGKVVAGKVFGSSFYPSFKSVQVYAAAATTGTTSGTPKKLPIDTVSYDPSKSWSITNNNITLNPGIYSVSGAVNYSTNANAGSILVSLYVNGAETFREPQWQYAAATAGTYAVPFTFNTVVTTAGTVLDVRFFQNSGANVNINGGTGPVITWLSVNQIGGYP